MYQSYFGLTEAPFSIAPDPRYLYLSQRHQEALAHLLYGVSGDGGFVLLTGDVGAGKTTICRCLLDQIPDSCDVAYIFNPKLTVEELLSTVCAEFGVACPPGNTSTKVFVDCLNEYLLDANARGRHTVLIIDEAQNLSADVLEQMRLLTNLETNQRKLLQIILIGQPELATMLARPELRQLAQRIVARYHLGPLSKAEIATYVRHRLEVAGTTRQLFPSSLLGRLYRLSGGVPRVVNVICDRALLGTFVQGKDRVDGATLAKAAREVFDTAATPRAARWPWAVAGLVAVAGIALILLLSRREQAEPVKVAPSPPAAETSTVAAGERPQPSVTEAPATTTPATSPAAPPASLALPADAATAAQAKESTVPVAAPDWPRDELLSRSQDLAYTALFRAWGLGYEGGDPCKQALRAGLRCRTARGGLDELRNLNRPAVLELRNGRSPPYFAALVGLSDGWATLAIGAETRRVSLETLGAEWAGQYVLLWRLPQGASETIRLGDRGPAVAWLARQLARAQGRTLDASKEMIFDDALARQVKQFQIAQGMTPDGAVGPQTLIRLAGVGDETAPKLRP